jgi:hypothetical protein
MGPHVSIHELWDQRVKGARALLDILRQQEKTHFPDIITGDASWIFIDTAPSSVWSSLDEGLPIRRCHTVGADKRMSIAFCGIKGLVHMNWLPKDVRINRVYFRDMILIPISQKLRTKDSGGHKPWT